MAKRRIITLLMAALWVITSSPYIASALFFTHGNHRITTDTENGVLALVFHHDGQDSDHSHTDHSHDKEDHSKTDGDHHVATISANVATFPSLNTQVVTKYIPVILFSDILATLTQVLTLDRSYNLLSNEAEGIPIPIFSLRTIVLLI